MVVLRWRPLYATHSGGPIHYYDYLYYIIIIITIISFFIVHVVAEQRLQCQEKENLPPLIRRTRSQIKQR